jgi:hypothetical protein
MTETNANQEEGARSDRERLWFFLGGRDLEMVTIRDLLAEAGIETVSDRNLGWGAKASQYGDEIAQRLSEGYKPVLIELEEDIGFESEQVEIVDHHGDRAGKDAPTSLQQVYKLLGLDFEQAPEEHRAVAANDRGHVPELREQGFSAERIRSIREKEWAVKGITQEEMTQAVNAIRQYLEISLGVVIVRCMEHDRSFLIADLLLEEFSDRWRGDEIPSEAIEPAILLVEGPSEWNLYGPGWAIEALKDRYPIEQTWDGGALPLRGYWGASKTVVSASSEALINAIDKKRLQTTGRDAEEIWLLTPEDAGSIERSPGSLTQFILPIAYEPERLDSIDSAICYEPLDLFKPRTEYNSSNDRLDDVLNSGGSQGTSTQDDDQDLELLYERRRYFTEETGNMLYQHAGWFELKGLDFSAETLSFQSQATRRSIRFRISRPRLVLFNWSVSRKLANRSPGESTGHDGPATSEYSNPLLNGFLILEIFPEEPITLAEIREFNETFRHVQMPYEAYASNLLESRYRRLYAKGFPWPQRASGSLGQRITSGKWLDLLEFPVCERFSAKKRYYRVVPREWIASAAEVTSHDAWAGQDHALKPAEPKSLVWSCAVLSENVQRARSRLLSRREQLYTLRAKFTHRSRRRGPEHQPASLGDKSLKSPSRRQQNIRAGDWIGFLNIDLPPGRPPVRHEQLLEASGYEKQWAEQESVTYQRWAHWGTLFGFTGHSGCAFLPGTKEPPFWRQWRTIYRDQALFLLYERATLFRFSRSISSLTQRRLEAESGTERDKRGANQQFEKDFEELRRHFVSFANLYQFPLLSTEQQSLEMYHAQRKALNVDPLYAEVQSQIDNAHAYASLTSQKKAAQLTTVITVLGIPLLLAGLIASVFGMDMAVPYAALHDLVSKTGGDRMASTLDDSSGFVRFGLWLGAVLAVLLPVRLFENRLIDFSQANNHGLTRSLQVLWRLVGLALFVVLIVMFVRLVAGPVPLKFGVFALAGVLVAWLAYLLLRIKSAARTFWATASIREALKMFFLGPSEALSLSKKFSEIIRRELESQARSNEKQKHQEY